jgi:hypothetical protein
MDSVDKSKIDLDKQGVLFASKENKDYFSNLVEKESASHSNGGGVIRTLFGKTDARGPRWDPRCHTEAIAILMFAGASAGNTFRAALNLWFYGDPTGINFEALGTGEDMNIEASAKGFLVSTLVGAISGWVGAYTTEFIEELYLKAYYGCADWYKAKRHVATNGLFGRYRGGKSKRRYKKTKKTKKRN